MTRLGWILLIVVALSGCRIRVPFSNRLFFEHAPNLVPRAADCERCHREVYEEWRDSLHARAWTSEAFQLASAKGRASECVGCHIPAPVDATAPVVARSSHVDEGVTCVSCHLSPAPDARPLTMRGPVSRSSSIEIHPVFEEDPLYRSSELCGRCHREALAEWRASPDPPAGESKRTCQECHMPEVSRHVESYHPDHPYSAVLIAFERKETLRRHLFAVPEDAHEWLEISVERRPDATHGRLRVILRNALPHALPTGRFGRREVRVVAAWRGGQSDRVLVSALRQAIPARSEREVLVSLPPGLDPRAVRVRLERWNHREQAWVLLAREGQRPGDPEG